MTHLPISRRTLLKGLGVSVALPFLEAMLPKLAFGQQAAARAFPRRMAFCYVPNGVNVQAWTPNAVGRDFLMPKTLQPLLPFRDDLLILSGLTCDKARPNGDGPGDHARAMAAFLTCRQPRKTQGADIRAGVSVDQLCAQNIGNRTRFPSLEIGCEPGRQAGGCDSGYSCAYSSNLSWRGESTPQPKETNPRAVFDRMFASEARDEAQANRQRRDRYNQSILDFVLEDANQLIPRLGINDQRRMDEYLTSLREVERRVTTVTTVPGVGGAPALERPSANPADYRNHLRVMADLLVVAFQADLTRIATFVFANEGSNRNYRIIDVADGHHDLSHHQNNREKLAKIARINRFHMEQFAYLVGRMRQVREGEGEGTMLDNCMVLYGSGNGDGNRHNHDELPVVLVGKGGGTLATGQHLRYPRNTPIANLYLEMLERMDVRVDSFGDSNGRLGNLA
jgi:hypothetical protein